MIQRAERHLDGFLDALAAAGIEMSTIRRGDFLRGLTLAELTTPEDLYWTARVTTVSRVEDIPVFDRVFAAWFGEGDGAEAVEAEDPPEEEEGEPPPETGAGETPPPMESGDGTGERASLDELLASRRLTETDPDKRELCRQITETAARTLPRQRARRLARARHHGVLDLRRILALLRRGGGEIPALAYRRRPWRPRRVLMLIDVSGSLKATSPDALRYAHALMTVAPRMEVFTFGTRLTRVTPQLARRDVDDALSRLSEVIFDFDGGTRIGPTFEAFLEDNRSRTLARGALVLVVSDGLERGDVDPMRRATDHLARLAHRLVWLTPLMADPAYRPETRGMKAVLGSLDHLGDAASLAALRDEIASLDDRVERRPRRGVSRRVASINTTLENRRAR